MSILLLCSCLATGCFLKQDDDSPCCGKECYPDPEGATNVLYVNPECVPEYEVSDGSLAKPYSTFSEALVFGDEGATILAAACEVKGVGIVVDRPVTILGMGHFDEDTGEYVDKTFLRPEVEGDAACIFVSVTSDVTIKGITVPQAYYNGIQVLDSSNVTLISNHIHDVTEADTKTFGCGISVINSTEVRIEGNFVADTPSTGIVVAGSTGNIKSNRVSGSYEGILLVDSPPFVSEQADLNVAPIQVTDNRLDGSIDSGIKLLSAIAAIDGNEVTDVVPDPSEDTGAADGIAIAAVLQYDGSFGRYSRVSIGEKKGNKISKCGRAGVLAENKTQVSSFAGNVVESNSGPGLWIQSGSDVQSITGNTFDGNTLAGIGLLFSASAYIGGDGEKLGNVVVNTVAKQLEGTAPNTLIGDGIMVLGSSKATIRFNKVQANSRVGILVDSPDPNFILMTNNMVSGGDYNIVIQAKEESQLPDGKVVDNFENVFDVGVCGENQCPDALPSSVVFHYANDKLLQVPDKSLESLIKQVESPCYPPACTE